MFKIGNVNEYSCLTIPVSIQYTVQPSTIIGGFNVSVVLMTTMEGRIMMNLIVQNVMHRVVFMHDRNCAILICTCN
jgi:hypothetical protein